MAIYELNVNIQIKLRLQIVLAETFAYLFVILLYLLQACLLNVAKFQVTNEAVNKLWRPTCCSQWYLCSSVAQ